MDKEYLINMSKMEKEFSSLYRNLASFFGLSECAMWVLYYTVLMGDKTTQQSLHEVMMFPKQTINSAVVLLERKGIVNMKMIPGTRNLKEISLTDSGMIHAERTVKRMISAELRAFGRMDEIKRIQFMNLHKELMDNLVNEFRKEEIGNV